MPTDQPIGKLPHPLSVHVLQDDKKNDNWPVSITWNWTRDRPSSSRATRCAVKVIDPDFVNFWLLPTYSRRYTNQHISTEQHLQEYHKQTTYQILDHLPQTRAVSKYQIGYSRMNLKKDIDVFRSRSERQARQGFKNDFPQRERASLQRHPTTEPILSIDRLVCDQTSNINHHSRFNLGDIQNIIDDPQQGISLSSYQIQILSLFSAQVATQSVEGQPDDSIQRSSYLMRSAKKIKWWIF